MEGHLFLLSSSHIYNPGNRFGARCYNWTAFLRGSYTA